MILFLLKLIGIILLCILGLLLLILLLILFAPIRYYAQVEYEKGNLRVSARVTWLAIFRFYLRFLEKKLSYRFNVLFLPIINSERKKREKKVKVARKDKKIPKEEGVENEKNTEITQAPVEKELISEPESAKEAREEPEVKEPETKQTTKTKRKFFKWKFRLLHPAEVYDIIVTKLMDIWDTISKKVQNAVHNLDKICEMITSEENHEMIREILTQVGALFRHIRPKKHGIYLKAGFSDPALTGQVLGAYSVINNILALNFVLEPDFDKEILEVRAYVKGRIRVINLLIIGIRVIRNKTLRKLIRRK